jgi:hypothetical protein
MLPLPHEPGQRARYRLLLAEAIEQASSELALAERRRSDSNENGDDGRDGAPSATMLRATLAQAHAAKAADALHGAGQLSRSAQRAPTREACDDGWRKVEAIAAGAEVSAREAALLAAELESDARESSVARSARVAARNAAAAAQAARTIVEARNHAYTFHTDSRFSFGEGWYLAAASVLAGVSIQIEPGKDGTPKAERFLSDAGLSGRIQAYRSRPRAMKQTTELVGRAFRADPLSAQQRLRAAFLGYQPIADEVRAWVDRRLEASHTSGFGGKKVLLWIRDGVHHASRNTKFDELSELTALVRRAGLVPILIGDALPAERVPDGAVDMILFWKDSLFRGADMRRAQLHFFEHLRERHGLVGQLGVTTAGMDGPALMGLPTLYLTDAPNVRMREWVAVVPGYEEVVREPGYLERVTRVLGQWRAP